MSTITADSIVEAYADLLVEGGPRQATLDAVARACGLSRAGLLHHHPSRRALDAALLGRLDVLVQDDLARMTAAPEGPSAYYLASSVDAGSPLERTVVAVSRLAQAGDAAAARALRTARGRWHALVLAEVGDPSLATLVILAGDGVSYQMDIDAACDTTETPFVSQDVMTDIVQLLTRRRSG